jgi:RNA polymerase sigma-70 factor (ECF subfamily)
MSSTLLDHGAARMHEAHAEALVADAAAGLEQGLAGLYDLYGRRAFGLALRVLRDGRLAEDAVQDAFLTVWRSASGYRPELGAPGTWILTIVHRRAVDIVRREQRQRADRVEEPDEPTDDDATDETVLDRETCAHVRHALARLAPGQRRVLELAYYGGLTQSEIAIELDLPVGTIKSRAFAALSRLRSLLEDEGVSSGRREGPHGDAGGGGR